MEKRGMVIRKIIEQHNAGKATKIRDISDMLSVSRADTCTVIAEADSFLQDCGYSLVGINGHVLSDLSKSESVFIVKASPKENPTIDDIAKHVWREPYINYMFLIFSFIHFENGLLPEELVVPLFESISERRASFPGEMLPNILKSMESGKFIRKIRKGERTFFSYGWRYYAEFPGFSPEGFFSNEKNA